MDLASKKTTIVGNKLPGMPWEEKPEGYKDILWRSQQNPIIPRDLIPSSNSIFNSAVVPFEKGYAGVFRCDSKSRRAELHTGQSNDGIHWDISPERIDFISNDSEIATYGYGYDPRICWIEDRYYITWCNNYHGPTIGVAYQATLNLKGEIILCLLDKN